MKLGDFGLAKEMIVGSPTASPNTPAEIIAKATFPPYGPVQVVNIFVTICKPTFPDRILLGLAPPHMLHRNNFAKEGALTRKLTFTALGSCCGSCTRRPGQRWRGWRGSPPSDKESPR